MNPFIESWRLGNNIFFPANSSLKYIFLNKKSVLIYISWLLPIVELKNKSIKHNY